MGFIIIGITAIATVASQLDSLRWFRLIQLCGIGTFYCVVLITALKQVLRTKKTDNNKIVGAICIYLLLGMLWTVVYAFFLEIDADAFNSLGSQDWTEQFTNLTYFSFTCLSTLGFGDIVPITPTVKFFAYMEL